MRTSGIYGFYPIVDSMDWVARLLPLGVKTIQLRIKDKPPEEVRAPIREAIALAKDYECQLVINDYWQLALEYDAEFIHLGQEDLEDADKDIIEKSGVKLGISTHTDEELARALTWPHDHIALGPIYETTLKVMSYAPQGLECVGTWKHKIDCPLIGIGGINLEHAPLVLDAGADAIAVVSDVVFNPNPEQRVEQWLELFNRRN
jgi:thiamine-phosphate pyrophosphorylase